MIELARGEFSCEARQVLLDKFAHHSNVRVNCIDIDAAWGRCLS